MPSLSEQKNQIENKLKASKTYVNVSKQAEKLKSKAANSETQSKDQTASQLNKADKEQKRYQKDSETSMDRLMGLLSSTKGNGNSSIKYIRKKLIEAFLKIENKAVDIITDESIKALGCTQEQTYLAIPDITINLQNLKTLPQTEGIYIPITSLDIFGNLKTEIKSKLGVTFYEKEEPSGNVEFKPFGGGKNFPMNKALKQLTEQNNINQSFQDLYGKFYTGRSGQKLFDITYTNENSIGESGEYYRVFLLDRESSPQNDYNIKLNKVGSFMKDYYSTIKIVDSVNVTNQLVNLITNAVSIQAKLGYGELNEKNKFQLLVQRILGLCFDDRREIDVSGISKVAELDGIDESFWELNEIDLRYIDKVINNTLNKVVEFEGCDGVKIPVESESLVNQLVELRETYNEDSVEKNTKLIENILDSITEKTPELLNSINFTLQVNKNIIKLIPLAVASAILTPKVLLPIYVMLICLKSKAVNAINSGIREINAVANSVDFLKIFKGFSISVITRINSVFLEQLFLLLKQDIINLMSTIIKDINKSSSKKRIAIYLRLAQLAMIIIPAISDYKKCKSLLDDILNLLNLITTSIGPIKPPNALLLFSSLLPGFSPERAAINIFEIAENLGLPTGDLPDGSPNLMNQLVLAITQGTDAENINKPTWTIGPGGPSVGISL